MTGCASTSGRHDRATDYTNHNCRCAAARADRERRRKRRHIDGPRRIDATGARRRLQALMRIGWSQNELNVRIGRSRSGSLGPLLWTDRPTVHVDVDQRIRQVFAELASTPGPSKVTAIRAEARGWLEPKWWDSETIDDPSYVPPTDPAVHWTDVDPIAVERACQGDHLDLTRGERIAAILHLHSRGLNQKAIARQLRISDRHIGETIVRHAQQVAS